MIDWNYYRSMFPVTKNYVYFITAGAGPIPFTVCEAVNERYRELAIHGGKSFQRNIETVEECRLKVAKLINSNPENIAFIPTVSFGMNALAKSLQLKSSLLIPDEEFPSTSLPWLNAKHNVKFVASEGNLERNIVQHLNNEGDDSSLILSQVQYSTGFRVNLDKITQHIKGQDSLFIVNGTQSIGSFPIDIEKDNVSAFICSCWKWLFCGEGIAFMYIQPKLFKKIQPGLVGWRSSPFAMQMRNRDVEYYNTAQIFELGWPNMAIFAGFNEALNIIFEIGIENISEYVAKLMSHFVNKLIEKNIPILSNMTRENMSGIILLGPFDNADDLVRQLDDRGILVNKRGNGIRVSLHFYNNEDDIEKFITIFSQLI